MKIFKFLLLAALICLISGCAIMTSYVTTGSKTDPTTKANDQEQDDKAVERFISFHFFSSRSKRR